MPPSCLGVLMLLLGLPVAHALDWSDDFTRYPAGSDASPTWDTGGGTWEVQAGKLTVDDPAGFAVLAGQPCFRRVSVEATLTLQRAASLGWKVAGVAIHSDARNYWHMALVEPPPDRAGQHYVELAEMRDGQWLAQTNLQGNGSSGLGWQYDTPYRLRIAMTPEGIEGQVRDMAGKPLVSFAYKFTAPAVTSGRPALRSDGYQGQFSQVQVAATDPVPDTTPKPTVYPAYRAPGPGPFQGKATGFFRTEQRDGRWWLVAPDGEGFLAVGTDHCRYEGHFCQKLNYAPYGRKNDGKYRSHEEWAAQATARLRSWGFNLLGAGGGGECRYQGLAHTEFIAFGSSFSDSDSMVEKTNWTGFPNVFSPRWPRYCQAMARRACAEHKTDPWLFGYFLDNELEWYGKTGSEGALFDEAMKRPANHSAKRGAVDYLKAKYATVGDLNKAWGAQVASFEALPALTALGGANQATVAADKRGFVRLVADLYFKHATAAIRKADPNHLILGCRFAGGAPADIWDICGNYCDIVTFNSYDRVDLAKGEATGVAERFRGFFKLARKPMMLTEWSFPALDAGLPSKHGAGMRVDTQAQKAECFRIYQEMLFRLPFMVGSDYFMWVDEPALGISDTFPEDSNYGLVNEEDVPYAQLTAMAMRVNKMVYALHGGDYPDLGVTEDQRSVYNRGKVAATFTLRVRVDGKATDSEVTLQPGEEQMLKITRPPEPGAHLVVVEVDPERKTADADRSDNLVARTVWTPGVKLPAALGGRPAAALVVTNHSGRAVDDATAVVPLKSLPAAVFHPGDKYVTVTDLDGHDLPSQVDGQELAVGVGRLEPWACRTLLVSRLAAPSSTPAAAGRLSTVGNGVLAFEWDQPATGNVVDRVLLRGDLLGSYNPLVWQEVEGQNFWAPTTQRIGGPPPAPGPVRWVWDVTCQGGAQAGAITAVDPRGAQEPARAQPLRFEVSHRLVTNPGCPWFLARLNYVKNTSDRALTLKGYFFYLYGQMGGGAGGAGADGAPGNHPAGPDVPDYYADAGAAWQEDKTGLVCGCVPLDDRILTSFWLDEGSRQHPDARQQLSPPVVLKPGETYRDADAPWLLIYGGQGKDKPWLQMRQVAGELHAIKAEIRPL